MGIPVVATSIGAEGLSAADEPTVALANTEADFARVVIDLAGSAQAREALRAAAFRKVSASFGWTGIVDGLMARYRDMLAAREEHRP
jgi:glycosyltransferase involved in cell wall biosynthesis